VLEGSACASGCLHWLAEKRVQGPVCRWQRACAELKKTDSGVEAAAGRDGCSWAGVGVWCWSAGVTLQVRRERDKSSHELQRATAAWIGDGERLPRCEEGIIWGRRRVLGGQWGRGRELAA
jgi:hypothetical protein